MNVAVLHYHLNRGGVTQVIANHLQALAMAMPADETARIAILYGGRREGWSAELPSTLDRLDLRLCELPELDYDDGVCRSQELTARLTSQLEALGFDPGETVIHAQASGGAGSP